jgi:pimeloyl-ACP methyl ester carboxylesterase
MLPVPAALARRWFGKRGSESSLLPAPPGFHATPCEYGGDDRPNAQERPMSTGSDGLLAPAGDSGCESRLKSPSASNWVVRTRALPGANQLLFLHSLGDTRDVWAGAFSCEALAGHTLMAPALPGSGMSPLARTPPLHLEEVATELVSLLRSVRDPSPGRRFVVGHSMGGVLATLIAEQWPDAIAGVLNVEGNLTRADCEVVSNAIVASARGGLASLERALPAVASGLHRDGRATARYARSLGATDPRAALTAAEDLIRLSRAGLIGRRFAHLDCPHLYVSGDAVPAASADLLRRCRCPWTTIRGAGHWVMEDKPSDFYALVAEWIAAIV